MAQEHVERRLAAILAADVAGYSRQMGEDEEGTLARLEGIAEPGGVCISEDAFRQVRGKIDAEFDDTGEQNLKNITRPVRVYRVRSLYGSAEPAVLTLPEKPSIAVLPFQNISGDPEQEYFADGMVEEIITALSKVRWFFVIARNSSFTYKPRAVDVKQVGRELGVRYALEGSVRKAVNRLRITAQLVARRSYEEAIRSAEHARRLSPNDRLIGGYALHATLGAHFAAGRYVDCVAWAHRTIERSPENQAAHYFLVAANAMLGDRAAAVEALGALMRLRPDFSQTWLSENMAWAGEVGERLPRGPAQGRSAAGMTRLAE